MRKNDFGRRMMKREQFEEDGRTIYKLSLQCRWLARQLAASGKHPDYPQPARCNAELVERLAEAWIAASEQASADVYGALQQGRPI